MVNNLRCILEDLNEHKRDRSEIMEKSVSEKLTASVQLYYQELTESLNYLMRRNEIRVLKKLNKD